MLPNPKDLKKIFLMSSCAAIIICAATLSNPVFAETAYDGLYLGLLGGVAYTPNYSNDNIDNTGLSGSVNYNHSIPYTAGADLGYKYGPFRYEIEGLYLHSNYKSFSPSSNNIVDLTNFNGSTQAYSGMANIIYNFDQSGDSGYFYLGLGAGYAQVRNKLATQTIAISQTTSGFAMQGIVGYAYNISSSLALGIDYRYFTTLKSIEVSDERYQNHLFNLGFNYFFG